MLGSEKAGKKTDIQYVHRRFLPIPQMVDDYNHFMGGVDIADQLRAKFSTQQRTHRSWFPLFFWMLDTSIVNAYILSEYYRKSQASYDPKKRVRGTHRAFQDALVDGLLLPYKAGVQKVYLTKNTPLPASRFDHPDTLH